MILQARVVGIQSGKVFTDGHPRYILEFEEADAMFRRIQVSALAFNGKRPSLDTILTLTWNDNF